MAYAEDDPGVLFGTVDDEDTALKRLLAILGAGQDEKRNSPAMIAFQQHLANVPERKDRGIITKLALALAGGFSGPEKSINAYNAPHNREVQDWQLRGSGLQHSADVESRELDKAEARKTSMLGMGLREMDSRRRSIIDENRAKGTADYQGRMAGAAERRAIAAEKGAGSLAESRKGMLGEQQKRTEIMRGALKVRQEQAKTAASALRNVDIRAKMLEDDNRIQQAILEDSSLSKYFERKSDTHYYVNDAAIAKAPEEVVWKVKKLLNRHLQDIFLPPEPPTSGRNLMNAPQSVIMPQENMPEEVSPEEDFPPDRGW